MRRPAFFPLALFLCGVLVSAPAAVAQTNSSDETPFTTASTTDPFVRALYRHMPVLRFDSGEDFFPLRVKAMTDNPGNRLERANEALLGIRRADGRGLNIYWLRGLQIGLYPSGDSIVSSDKLDARGGDPDDHIREDAQRFQSNPAYRDRVYGRVVRLRDGDRVTGAWLQYWFFYYHNDFPRTDAGDHEGDWEMIQVKVNADAEPLVAVYAQHNRATWCSWRQVRKQGRRPVVFVALGSHAAYFRADTEDQDRDNDGERGRPLSRLIRIGNNRPQWVNWPGHWGDDGSPRGPKFQGLRWTNPEAFFDDTGEDEECQ